MTHGKVSKPVPTMPNCKPCVSAVCDGTFSRQGEASLESNHCEEETPEWKRMLNNRSTPLAHTIMHRRRVWWRDRHKGVHSVDECLRSGALDRCCPFWQRKLEDKLLSRQFAQSLGVPVPQLLWSGKDPRDIPFAQLEARRLPYVVKCSRGDFGKQVLLISARGKRLQFTRATPISHAEIVAHMQGALAQYPNACILVEEFVQHWDPASQHRKRGPVLYRVWIHGDRVAALYIDNQHTGLWRRADWQPFPFLILHEENEWPHARLKGRPPPAVYERMLRYAQTLGVAYRVWVRIDFFITPDGPVFNEFSQTPFEGRGFTREGSDYMMREWIAPPLQVANEPPQCPSTNQLPKRSCPDKGQKPSELAPVSGSREAKVGRANKQDPATPLKEPDHGKQSKQPFNRSVVLANKAQARGNKPGKGSCAFSAKKDEKPATHSKTQHPAGHKNPSKVTHSKAQHPAGHKNPSKADSSALPSKAPPHPDQKQRQQVQPLTKSVGPTSKVVRA